jgi:hypothetical protein
MPTAKKIADIKANLLHPALTSHFEVEIPIPLGLINNLNYLSGNGLSGFKGSSGKQGQLQLMCSEATLPGSNLATFDINDNFHGVTERHAYRRVYDDRIDLTFYVDAENYIPIRYFETWMKYVAGESVSAGGGMLSSKDPNYFYRVNYPKDYMATGLKVTKFERTAKVTANVTPTSYEVKGDSYTSKTLEYEFINAFPISVSSMPVSYDSSSLLKCSVSLSYIRYILIPPGTDPAPTGTTSGLPTKATGDPSGPNFNATPQQIAQVNGFNSNIDLSSVTGNIPGGVPFDSAGASQTSTFTPF